MFRVRIGRTAPTFGLLVFGTALFDLAGGATFTVTTTADSGAGSLRQAILDADASPGGDLITFAIPGSGVQTIAVATALPAITEPVAVDGYTQPGSVPNSNPYFTNAVLRIELQGSGTDGLTVTGGATSIRGLAMHGFQNAIATSALGGNWIAGNFLGTDASGAPTSGNTNGVSITGTSGDIVGGEAPADKNLISGNTIGVLATSTSSLRVDDNLIGTTASGFAAIGNGTGVRLVDSTSAYIGYPGSGGGTRDVISGNLGNGIETVSSGGFVGLSAIGADVSGFAALGNGGSGIQLTDSGFTIQDNVISGNAIDGINLANSNAVILHNFIGIDAGLTGVAIPNGRAGVRFEPGSTGSLATASGVPGILPNTVAFNGVGVWVVAPQFVQDVIIGPGPIYANHGLGIVVGSAPTILPNDPGGSMLNFPLLTSVVSAGGNTTFEGIYNGPQTANAVVTLQFYASPACSPRPRQFDEGMTYLGAASAPTGGVPLPFSIVLPVTLTDERVTVRTTTFVHFPLQGSTDGGFVPWTLSSPFSQRLPFSISPASGADTGGAPVTISGTDFRPGAVVTIGGLTPANVVIVDDKTITADAPALPAGSASDVVVTNTDGTHGTLALGWVADFLDVPPAHPFHDYVVTLVSNAVASGVGSGNFGADNDTLRQQMAVFLLKGKHGLCYVPPPCTGTFADVPCPSAFADWIEALLAEGITGGCGGANYCPQNPVRRDQMAVFLLKAEHGPGYAPPPCAGMFSDVPCPSAFADWIEQLADEGITGGCGGDNYCPGNPNTRGQMAVFFVKTFDLQ